ncbi:MAG: hypothetical protein R3C39_01085 [Dehalococcoidia bacterium]
MSVRSVVVLGLVLAAAVVAQLGIVPALFLDRLGAPVLPVAVLAAWSASRRPEAAWIAAVPLALMLASVSEVRAGWFVLALAPTPLLATSIHARVPALPAAALGAAAGASVYVATLALAANRLPLLTSAFEATMRGALLTALAGLAVAVLFLPFRPRETGLFRS